MVQMKIGIIGLGHIGASLAKVLKTAGKNKYYIIGIDIGQATLKIASKMSAFDEVSIDLSALSKCDIIVICTPVDTIAAIYKELSAIAGKKTIITDAGSVKGGIVKTITEFSKSGKKLPFIPAHPMAGKEKNGILSADANLFKGANVMVAYASAKPDSAAKKVIALWKDAGAKSIHISAEKHDKIVAITSHLPHLMAFALNKVYKDALKKNPETALLAAGSFKSATRVANSSADMWAPILNMNAANIKRELNSFIKELKTLEKTLGNKEAVKKAVLKTQNDK